MFHKGISSFSLTFQTLVLIALCLIPVLVFCQSVKITPKRVVYKRSGKNVPDSRRTFEVRYPAFGGSLSATALRNLKRNADYWRLFEMTLLDNLKDDYWLSSLDYQVRYNKNAILAIWLTAEGVGAYPDSITKYLVLDLRNGDVMKIEDLFEESQLTQLRDRIRRRMKASENALDKEMKEMLKTQREGGPEFHPRPEKLELENLEGFSISDRGVTFIYDYGYAHVVQALEPSGDFFIPISQLKSFIRRDGLLARFIR